MSLAFNFWVNKEAPHGWTDVPPRGAQDDSYNIAAVFISYAIAIEAYLNAGVKHAAEGLAQLYDFLAMHFAVEFKDPVVFGSTSPAVLEPDDTDEQVHVLSQQQTQQAPARLLGGVPFENPQ